MIEALEYIDSSSNGEVMTPPDPLNDVITSQLSESENYDDVISYENAAPTSSALSMTSESVNLINFSDNDDVISSEIPRALTDLLHKLTSSQRWQIEQTLKKKRRDADTGE